MFALYIALGFLGLSAIDPIGIAIMPILLVQKQPYKRAFIFLSGSFASLMVMGLLFSKGLERVVLSFEHHNKWFVPTIETLGGVILFVIATTLYVELRKKKLSVEPTGIFLRSIKSSNMRLFTSGALLVALQSLLDVVFVVAMVRVGQFHLSTLGLVLAIAVYAVTALILQLSVVISFKLAPAHHKTKITKTVHSLLVNYSYQALIVISVVLGCLLLILAI